MNEQFASCIRRIGEDLIALSDAILLPDSTGTIPTPDEGKDEKKASTKSTKKGKKTSTSEQSTPEQTTPEPITHEQLREFLGNLAAGGHSAEVAALLKEYGEGKLSTVPEESYPALYAAAKGIIQETEDQDTKGIGDADA